MSTDVIADPSVPSGENDVWWESKEEKNKKERKKRGKEKREATYLAVKHPVPVISVG